MTLTLYNSLTKQKEPFTAIAKNTVNLYSCGPTVYNTPHIGNYRSFVFSDLLHRFLKTSGYRVNLIMNITDIDNKTIAGTRAANLPLHEYTRRYEQEFFNDLKTLNFLPANHYPRASEHIPEMVAMIEILIAKGHAYEDAGSVYFKLASFTDYGKLSGIDVGEQRAGASNRIQADEYSRDTISDFALWKAHKPDEDGDIFYETSLGKGRPGWHIECSAMSQKYLGTHFDIHTGGIDNKFPHHENEIAQSVCATGKPFVNYWLHAAHLMIEGEKMSKSLGNIYTLCDLIAKGAHPIAIRYMLLSSHYRHTYNFTFTNIDAAEKALTRLARTLKQLETLAGHPHKQQKSDSQANVPNQAPTLPASESPGKSHSGPSHAKLLALIHSKKQAFTAHLEDDLNTSGALGELFELTHALTKVLNMTEPHHSNTNTAVPQEIIDAALGFYLHADSIFGFDLGQFTLASEQQDLDQSDLPIEIQSLVTERNTLRSQKAFTESDIVRKKLLTLGYQLIDTQEKTLVQKISASST